jgi:uncharacterized protein (TIGR00369 family)
MRTAQDIFPTVPINRHLGSTLERCDTGGAVVAMEPRAEYLQEGGAVQGGIVSALADAAAAYALIPTLGPRETMTGVEFKVNFLRGASLEGGTLRATSRLVRRGRKVAVIEVSVAQSGAEVALALFTFLFLPRPANAGYLDPPSA